MTPVIRTVYSIVGVAVSTRFLDFWKTSLIHIYYFSWLEGAVREIFRMLS